MSKHTPGPWAAFTDDSGSNPHTNIVAVVPITDCVFFLQGHDKSEPNVRLISAAPELLAALVEVLEQYQGVVDADRTNRCGFNEYDEVVAARAAIAKATGEPA